MYTSRRPGEKQMAHSEVKSVFVKKGYLQGCELVLRNAKVCEALKPPNRDGAKNEWSLGGEGGARTLDALLAPHELRDFLDIGKWSEI